MRLRWLRKLAAVLLVLGSVTAGMVGLGLTVEGTGLPGGRGLGVLLMLLTPLGIWTALRVTPEGGTTGYLDQNI